MPQAPPILEMTRVAVESAEGYDSALWNVSLSLGPGELAAVKLERGFSRLPLADAAQGLAEPTEGNVRFEARDWRSLSAWEAAALRGRVGRVFDSAATHGWVCGLDVDENILLARRHHTDRPAAEWGAEAAKLARAFGLPGLPRGRPDQVRAADLQRAALVRAFLGSPDLLLLEEPTRLLYPQVMQSLLQAIRAARARGAAVLWTTAEQEVWNEPALRPTFKYAMSGGQLLLSAAGAPAPLPRPPEPPSPPAGAGI